MGGIIGCQLSNFPNSCVSSSLLQKNCRFCAWPWETSLQQMMKTMLNDICMSDSGNFEESQPLQSSVPPQALMAADSTQVRPLYLVVLFIKTGKANDDGTLATVINIVHHGRSWLYTSVTVAIYHTLCPVGPRYDKSHSYLHLGVCNLYL